MNHRIVITTLLSLGLLFTANNLADESPNSAKPRKPNPLIQLLNSVLPSGADTKTDSVDTKKKSAASTDSTDRSAEDPTVPSRKMMEILNPTKPTIENGVAQPKLPQLPNIQLKARLIPLAPRTPLAVLEIDSQQLQVRPNTPVSIASDGKTLTIDVREITIDGVTIHVMPHDKTLLIH